MSGKRIIETLQLEPASQLFRALADQTRLRLVALLSPGELCVCHLAEALDLSQPMISRHLGILKNAGVVKTRRQGSWIYYQLAAQTDVHRSHHLGALRRRFKMNKELKREVTRICNEMGPTACR